MRFSIRAEVFAAALAASVLALPAIAQVAADRPADDGVTAQSLRDVVARYRDWRGPAYGELQTIHERFAIETATGRQAGQLWMDRDGRMRREVVAGDVRQIEVATPDGAWRTDADGHVVDNPAAVERARRYALLEFGDALTGRGGASVALAGTAEALDNTWNVVRITFGDADSYEALIDPKYGALCCYRITEGGQTRLQLFGEWRLVDGVRMPFITASRTTSDVQTDISAVELNRSLDPALFARPPSAAADGPSARPGG